MFWNLATLRHFSLPKRGGWWSQWLLYDTCWDFPCWWWQRWWRSWGVLYTYWRKVDSGSTMLKSQFIREQQIIGPSAEHLIHRNTQQTTPWRFSRYLTQMVNLEALRGCRSERLRGHLGDRQQWQSPQWSQHEWKRLFLHSREINGVDMDQRLCGTPRLRSSKGG